MRVLLADDETRVRFALRILLQRHVACDVVAEAADTASLVEQAGRMQPDLILLDWTLLGNRGRELVEDLRRLSSSVRILVLSGRPECGGAALAAGADAFVSKIEPPESLLAAVAMVTSDRNGTTDQFVLGTGSDST